MAPPRARALAVALAACIWRLPVTDALAGPERRLGRPLVPTVVLWTKAAEEEGIDPFSVSMFGANVPKFPRSMVESILAWNSTKTRSYNFMGTVNSQPGWPSKKHKRRKWVFGFAADNFGPDDFLNAMDVKPGYTPLGQFDQSERGATTEELLGHALGSYEVMAQSNFTLCPGGDETWSKRVYQAVLAGSLPLINHRGDDWGPRGIMFGTSIGGTLAAVFDLYKYVTVGELPAVGYREDWVMENRRNFIKYQTFMEGDNIPPNYQEMWAPGQTTNAYPCGHVIWKATKQNELEQCGSCCSGAH